MKQVIWLFAWLPFSTLAQHSVSRTYDNVLFQRTFWSCLDLRDVRNAPLTHPGQDMVSALIRAFEQGEVKGYTNDSLNQLLTQAKFQERLRLPIEEHYTEEEVALGLRNGDSSLYYAMLPDYFTIRDMVKVRIKELAVFDKVHSRMEWRIVSLSLFIPADNRQNAYAYDLELISFDYAAIANTVFAQGPQCWYRAGNEAASLTLKAAFDQRLFYSYVEKVSNARDEWLVEQYGNKAYIKGQEQKNALLDLEYALMTWQQEPKREKRKSNRRTPKLKRKGSPSNPASPMSLF
jgi:hypothetical protein